MTTERKATLTIVNHTGFQMQYARVHLFNGEFDDKPVPDSNDQDHHYFPQFIEIDGRVKFEVKNAHSIVPIGPHGYVSYFVMDGATIPTQVTVNLNHLYGPGKSTYTASYSNDEIQDRVFKGSYSLEPSDPQGKEQEVTITLDGEVIQDTHPIGLFS